MNFEKVKWPSSVPVLGTIYSITVVDSVDEDGSEGVTHRINKTIRIKRQKRAAMWSALFHEIAHAWLEESMFNVYLDDESIEELLVCMIEQQYVPILLSLSK